MSVDVSNPVPVIVVSADHPNTPVPVTFVGFGIATKTLTNAQIKALPTVGGQVEVVAAVGSGKGIFPLRAFFSLDPSAGAYTFANNPKMSLVGTAGKLPLGATQVEDLAESNPLFTDSSTDKVTISMGSKWFKGGDGTPTSSFDNSGLRVALSADDNVALGGGHVNNTLKVTVIYVIVDL